MTKIDSKERQAILDALIPDGQRTPVKTKLFERILRDTELLADGTRLRIILTLLKQSWPVTKLAHKLGESQPGISYHLNLREFSDIVGFERKKSEHFYSLRDVAFLKRIHGLFAILADAKDSEEAKKTEEVLPLQDVPPPVVHQKVGKQTLKERVSDVNQQIAHALHHRKEMPKILKVNRPFIRKLLSKGGLSVEECVQRVLTILVQSCIVRKDEIGVP